MLKGGEGIDWRTHLSMIIMLAAALCDEDTSRKSGNLAISECASY